jgi:hypothetical protein
VLGASRPDHEMLSMFRRAIHGDQAQDMAEYAVMLVVILVIVIGTVKLISIKRNSPPRSVGTSLQR